jgi:hypothetical protein
MSFPLRHMEDGSPKYFSYEKNPPNPENLG